MSLDLLFGIVLIIVLAIVVLYFFIRSKRLKYGNMVLVTGALKTGKSLLSVCLAIKKYKSQHFKWRILKLFRRKNPPEEPMLYCNVPLRGVPFVPLTEDLLCRRKRFSYGSVVYMQESSLIADSMTYKDDELNERLLLFNKLFAHETKGGYLFYDTQSVADNHYAVRRCLGTYFHIQSSFKVPFFVILRLREMLYSEDNSMISVAFDDVEATYKFVIVRKKWWRYYDRFCYSVFTDHLPVLNNPLWSKKVMPRLTKLVSFRTFFTLQGFVRRNAVKESKNDKKVS